MGYKPWWFYFGALFKGVFFGLPLVFLGTAELIRRPYLVLGCAAWLVGPAFVLSLFKVKEAAYVSQAYPALAILMACGVKPFLKTGGTTGVWPFSALVSISLAGFFFAVGVVTRTQFLMIMALYLLYLAAVPAKLILPHWRKLAAVAACAGGAAAHRCGRRTAALEQAHPLSRDRNLFQTSRGPAAPGTPIFTSPEYAALSFYLFRQGDYWETFYFHQDDVQFRDELEHGARLFYVVDPSGTLYGGKIKPEWEALLAQNTRDVTPAIEQATGTKIGLRVLTPSAEPSTENNK